MTKAYDTVGYTFKADNYCPPCTIEILIQQGEASPAARDMAVEDALDQIAGANAIDRDDLHSFDSDDFPKPIFSVQVEDSETCGNCQAEL